MIPYEILIRGKEDGTLSGAHVIDVAGGSARAITAEDIESLAPSINAASLALFGKIEALEAYKAEMIEKVTSALSSGDPVKMQELAVEFLTPAEEIKRAEKVAQYEALKTELGL